MLPLQNSVPETYLKKAYRIPSVRKVLTAGIQFKNNDFITADKKSRAMPLVISGVEDVIQASTLRYDTLVSSYERGETLAPDTEEYIRQELRWNIYTGYAVGMGSYQFSKQDLDNLNRIERTERGYLDNFLGTLTLLSIAEILKRLKLYAQSAYPAMWGSLSRVAYSSGAVLESRILSTGKNCEDCVRYASRGWVPIGTLPEPGYSSICLHNCRCTKIYKGL